MRRIVISLFSGALLALTIACGAAEPVAEAPAAEEHAPGSHDPVEVADATEFDAAALQARLEAGEEVFLLDVRNPDELVEHGQIEGAVNIPIDELESRLEEVPEGMPVVTYCMRGGRASRAADTLRKAGRTDPIEYGGITAWKEAGNPVVQPEGE